MRRFKNHRHTPNILDIIKSLLTRNLYGSFLPDPVDKALSNYIRQGLKIEPLCKDWFCPSTSYYKLGEFTLEINSKYNYINVLCDNTHVGYVSKFYYHLILSYMVYSTSKLNT